MTYIKQVPIEEALGKTTKLYQPKGACVVEDEMAIHRFANIAWPARPAALEPQQGLVASSKTARLMFSNGF